MFDKPYYRDWTVWLGVFAVVSGIAYTASHGPSNIIDYLIAVGFQWLLWAAVPAAVRQEVRKRKRSRV